MTEASDAVVVQINMAPPKPVIKCCYQETVDGTHHMYCEAPGNNGKENRVRNTLANIRYDIAWLTPMVVECGAPAEVITNLDLDFAHASVALGDARWPTKEEEDDAGKRGHYLFYVLVPSGQEVCKRGCRGDHPAPEKPKRHLEAVK